MNPHYGNESTVVNKDFTWLNILQVGYALFFPNNMLACGANFMIQLICLQSNTTAIIHKWSFKN